MNRLPVLSLHRRKAELADPAVQRQLLDNLTHVPTFDRRLAESGIRPLRADGVKILQVNVGKMCNMTCHHCHVDAGPDRREIMTAETIEHCLNALRQAAIPTLDLTGGAPEMNPHFRNFVSSARKLGCHVIDRCNLTILLANGYEDMVDFLADNQVEIVASLPCYLAENADAQRGDGAFAKSIRALKLLNERGYGKGDKRHVLTLVYNPIGPTLPPAQTQLEQAYKEHLAAEHDVHFDRLFTITNMPISRFLENLQSEGRTEEYMTELVNAFNPAAAEGVMCRRIVSVSWDGRMFDCDFNQMLELPLATGVPQHIRDFDLAALEHRKVTTGRHCFGCTASAGSGCLGAIDV